MQHIITLDFIDVSVMAAALLLRHHNHFEQDPHCAGAKIIPLRSFPAGVSDSSWTPDAETEDTKVLAAWPTALRVLQNIYASHVSRVGFGPTFGKVGIWSLEPNSWRDWQCDTSPYTLAHNRLCVCLVPSPGAWVYAGGEAAILPVGQLTYVNARTPNTALNVGPVAYTQLFVDVRIQPENTIN